MLRHFGRVDILINNVGPYSDLPFAKLPVATWDAVFDSNVRAPYLLAQKVAPGMRERGWWPSETPSATGAGCPTTARQNPSGQTGYTSSDSPVSGPVWMSWLMWMRVPPLGLSKGDRGLIDQVADVVLAGLK